MIASSTVISISFGYRCAVFKVRGEAYTRGLDEGRPTGGSPALECARRSLKTRQQLLPEGRTVGPVDIREARPRPARPALRLAALPRKEVIQPHLPVRLPCYDFTPVTGPTFDGSLPCGLGHRLRALPIPVV